MNDDENDSYSGSAVGNNKKKTVLVVAELREITTITKMDVITIELTITVAVLIATVSAAVMMSMRITR